MLFSGLFTGIFLELHAQVGIRPEKAESGGGKLLGKGHLALSRQLWGLGSAVSSPSCGSVNGIVNSSWIGIPGTPYPSGLTTAAESRCHKHRSKYSARRAIHLVERRTCRRLSNQRRRMNLVCRQYSAQILLVRRSSRRVRKCIGRRRPGSARPESFRPSGSQ